MPEAYITLEDAAGFEGIGYDTMQKRVHRSVDDFKVSLCPRDTGGKDQVLVAVSSLSVKARRAYRAAQKLEGRDAVIETRTEQPERPWYLDMDIHWYRQNYSNYWDDALALADRIRQFLDRPESERTASAVAFAAELGMSQRTMYRNAETYLEASAWALRLNRETGENHEHVKVLALCRKPKAAGTFPSLPPEQRALIENIWFDKDFASNLGTIEMLYDKFSQIAGDNDWTYPSIKTVARYVKYLMDSRRGANAHFLAANGLRAFKNQKMIKGKRDTKALAVLEFVQGDEHTLDCWVQVTHANGKLQAVRPKLVAWIDTRSRAIMGDVMCIDANTEILQQSMEEQLAVLGTLQATMSGSEAGTKYRAFLQTAAKAGNALGLSFVDANNQMRSLPEILGTLRTKYGDTLDAIEKQDIKKAFGSDEAVALIDQFYNKNDQLQESILNLNGTMGQGTAVTLEMANAINSTEPNRWQIITQKVQNLKEQVGNGLLPQFNRFMDMTATGIESLSTWIGENQELFNVILMVVGALGGILTVGTAATGAIGMIGLIGTKGMGTVGTLINAFKGVPGKIDTIRVAAMYAGDGLKAGFGVAKTAAITLGGGIGRAAAALPGLIGSVWSFTAALLANPITWVVVGIVTLIAVIILLWRNWDSVTAFISGAWNGFGDGIVAGFDWVRNLFAGMPMWLQIALAVFLPFIGIPMLIINHWGEITGFFSGLWGNVQSIFSSGIDTVKGVIDGAADWFFNSGSKIMTTFTNGIKSAISAPVDAVKGGLQKIRNMLPFSDAKVGPLSSLTLSGRRVLETLTTGIHQSEDMPAQAVDKSFGKVDLSAGKAGKVNLREVFRSEESSTSETTTQSEGIYINEFKMLIDPTKIRSLADLERIMQWMMDYIKSHGGTPTPAEG